MFSHKKVVLNLESHCTASLCASKIRASLYDRVLHDIVDSIDVSTKFRSIESSIIHGRHDIVLNLLRRDMCDDDRAATLAYSVYWSTYVSRSRAGRELRA